MENVFADQALQSYLNEISKIPTLSKEEERELAIKAKNGDENAKNKLVSSNLKFVVKIASHYQNRGLTLSELISEGNMGLIKAIEKYDIDKDIKLISYAVWWIKQKILFALAEKTSLIRVPLGRSNAINKIRNIRDRYIAETGDHISMDQLSDKSDISEKLINNIQLQPIETLSLDEISKNSNNDDSTILEFIEDTTAQDPKSVYFQEKLQNRIQNSIKTLNQRDSHIIKSYFGLEGYQEKNFAEIAEEMGISRERVRQIQKQALKKILDDSRSEFDTEVDYLLNYSYNK
jgi:RNA polymerase primary sigma factor